MDGWMDSFKVVNLCSQNLMFSIHIVQNVSHTNQLHVLSVQMLCILCECLSVGAQRRRMEMSSSFWAS